MAHYEGQAQFISYHISFHMEIAKCKPCLSYTICCDLFKGMFPRWSLKVSLEISVAAALGWVVPIKSHSIIHIKLLQLNCIKLLCSLPWCSLIMFLS